MKIGLIAANVGGPDAAENLVTMATTGEAMGLESIWTFEHVIVPVDYASRYPYHHSGKFHATPETNFVDPLIALTCVAAHTKTMRLGTGINIVPQTNPLLMAKQVASIDYLSGGRMMLGVGSGWLEEEFQAMGTPFDKRGARLDDYLAAMKKVWSGDVVEHQSEFLHWTGFKSYPVPVQRPHVPIIVGGTTPPALRRVVRAGDGWITVGTPEELAGPFATLKEEAGKAGRDLGSLEITSTWIYVKEGPDSIKQYEDLGVERVVVPWAALGKGNLLDNLKRFGDEVVAKHGAA